MGYPMGYPKDGNIIHLKELIRNWKVRKARK
jgi:hypothetical protein